MRGIIDENKLVLPGQNIIQPMMPESPQNVLMAFLTLLVAGESAPSPR
jgi:hypothetical protein